MAHKPLMCPTHLLEIDLTGHTYIVTGGNSGVGLATVAQLARMGANVVLACRRPVAGAAARENLVSKGVRGNVEVRALDLADLASVRAFTQAFLADLRTRRGRAVAHRQLHPGWVRTALVASFVPLWVQDVVLRPLLRMGGMLEPWAGAQTTLYALLAPEVADHPGAFFSQTGVYRDRSARRGGWPLRSPNPLAHDEDLAQRLDDLSRRLVGLAE